MNGKTSNFAIPLLWLISCNCISAKAETQQQKAADSVFQSVIAPAFEQSCIRCHNASKARGGLNLDTRTGLLKGSENGPVIEAGKPGESRLLEVISGEKPEMPQQDKPLEKAVVEAVKTWIAAGAPWPADLKLVDKSVQKDRKHWSLLPIVDHQPPELPGSHKNWGRNAIDQFVAKKHSELGFIPAAEADRRTLLRRLYFDLTGLPPEPAQVLAFVSDDSPDAYEKLVDQLLNSSAYGERWARHWLDIVHYGETHGYDKDKPRPNSWPYRDYVIRSLNDDKPYAQFVKEQIAGDLFFPEKPEAIKALGFLAAGPWDFIGHAEVPESKTDGKIARHLDRDDMVGTAVGSLMSLTVQCAQCHDHKFDPITQADYYQLQAVFAGIDRADRPYFKTSAEQLQYETLHQKQLQLTRQSISLQKQIEIAAGPEYQKWQERIAAASSRSGTNQRPEYGYHSNIEKDQNQLKWVQLNFKEPVKISRVQIAPSSDEFNSIGDGFGFPVRYKIEISDQADFSGNVKVIVDRTDADQPNPKIQMQEFQLEKATHTKYLRISATKLARRSNDFHFAIAEIGVINDKGVNVASNAAISALDSIEAPPRWRKTNLVDGIAPGGLQPVKHAGSDPETLRRQMQSWLKSKVSLDLLNLQETTKKELKETETRLLELKSAGMVYAATVHKGSGAFSGTGASGGLPREISRLNRGDVKQPIEKVKPGAIESLQFENFQLSVDQSENEAQRRAALARWITSRENPLFWRSIVNRVWQYHFGRGIVDSTGDFGRMGGVPSHPELLDYLATVFRDGGGKLKSLHRLIVTSATYRQSSVGNSNYALQDSANVALWRQNRRKLEAEAIRDSILAVSGKLNRTMGGPSFQDFVITHPEHSPHYEYDKADPRDLKLHRRSIYRFIVRSQPQPFLTTMDCADPSMRVDRRNESVSAAQALAQWNEALVLAVSADFGQWISNQPGSPEAQINAGFEKCFARKPTADELKSLVDFSGKYGTSALARLLLNLNEFSFVD